MEKIEITCAACQNGCHMEVTYEDGEMLDVEGNGCMKGMIYAQGKINKIEES